MTIGTIFDVAVFVLDALLALKYAKKNNTAMTILFCTLLILCAMSIIGRRII